MKTLRAVLVLGLVALMFSCGNDKKKSTTAIRNERGISPSTPYNPTTGTGGVGGTINQSGTWGQVSVNDGGNAAKLLASATMDPQQIGTISGGNTGVFFQGSVSSSSGGVYQSGNMQVNPSSALQIAIWDSYVGQVDQATGQQIPPIYINISPQYGGTASGTVNNGQAQITFQDQYGAIVVVGTVNQQSFQGTIYFQNFVSYNGAGASQTMNTLGQFQIATCAFFRCQ